MAEERDYLEYKLHTEYTRSLYVTQSRHFSGVLKFFVHAPHVIDRQGGSLKPIRQETHSEVRRVVSKWSQSTRTDLLTEHSLTHN